MKKTSLLVASALLASSALFAQDSVTSNVVGYVTANIKAGQFNLVGLNLSSSVVASGVIDGSTASTLTDNEGSFDTALTSASGEQYYIKLTNGGSGVEGLNTIVSANSASELNVADDLSSYVTNGVTEFEVRKLLTVADVFGATNSAELAGATAGNTSSADLIWVQDVATGAFQQIYYNSVARPFPPLSVGWKSTVGGNSDASSTPIYFTDGIFVQVQRTSFDSSEAGYVDASNKGIVITGAVETDNSEASLFEGFNYLSKVFPGGLTLGESGLEGSIATATAGNTSAADIVWVVNESGGYDKYYYNGVARPFPPLSVGWKGTTTGNTDQSAVTLSSAVIIEQKSATPNMATLPLPAGLDL